MTPAPLRQRPTPAAGVAATGLCAALLLAGTLTAQASALIPVGLRGMDAWQWRHALGFIASLEDPASQGAASFEQALHAPVVVDPVPRRPGAKPNWGDPIKPKGALSFEHIAAPPPSDDIMPDEAVPNDPSLYMDTTAWRSWVRRVTWLFSGK